LTRFEGKLEQYHGNLDRAAIELSKEWRTDKILRQLEALLVVADEKSSFLLSGNGDVISPDDGYWQLAREDPTLWPRPALWLTTRKCLLAKSPVRRCGLPAKSVSTATQISSSKNCNGGVEL
jgi:hypothetical protein